MVTKTFCISGTSNGRGWTWSLSGKGLPSQQVNVSGVSSGGSATDLAQQWVNSIQQVQGRPLAYTARFSHTAEDGRAYFTITARRNFRFGVDDCTITGNPNGCSFNPTVLDVSPPDSNITSTLLWVSIVLNLLIILAFILLFLLR